MQPVQTSQAIILVMSHLQDDDDEAEDILLPFQEASVQHVEGASRLSRHQPSLVRRYTWLTWAHCPAKRASATQLMQKGSSRIAPHRAVQHTACHHRTRCTDIGTNAFGAGAGQASEAVADLVAGHDMGGCRVCSTCVGGLQLGKEGLAEVGHALGLQRERHMGLHQLPLLLPVQLQRVLPSPLLSGPALLGQGLCISQHDGPSLPSARAQVQAL